MNKENNTASASKEQSYIIAEGLGAVTGKMRSLAALLFTIHSNMTDGGDIAESVYVASDYLERLSQDLESIVADVQGALETK